MSKIHSLQPDRPLPLLKHPVLPIALALGSGILMGLAPAPFNAFLFAWVAIAPLWVLIFSSSRTPSTSHLSPLLLAFLWGTGYHGLSLSWITGLHPLTWMGVPWMASLAITLFCWVFITLWGAAVLVVWTWIMTRLDKGIGLRTSKAPISSARLPHSPLSSWRHILVGTALWCGLEWLWSFGALYWTSVSYTQSPGNLAILHLGQLSGPLTVTAAIVAVNGLLAEAWMHYRQLHQAVAARFYLTMGIGLLLLLHLIGFGLSRQPLNQPDSTALTVGVIQGNVPTRIKLTEVGVRRAIDHYTQGYETLSNRGTEVVLTPEGALPILWSDRNHPNNPFYQAVIRQGTPAWLGTFVEQNNQITQSLITLTEQGDLYSRYNKIKLVPLGEYIPFHQVLGGLIGRLSPIKSSMTAGTSNQRFDTPFGRAIASICYESAFPELFRAQAADGGQFILTASNLDPYSETLMAQHQAHDLMRAIETDRWAARATNTGYSSFINPHGRVIWRSQPQSYEIHAETIYRRQTQTPYVRWGDWLTPLLLGLGAIGVVRSKKPF